MFFCFPLGDPLHSNEVRPQDSPITGLVPVSQSDPDPRSRGRRTEERSYRIRFYVLPLLLLCKSCLLSKPAESCLFRNSLSTKPSPINGTKSTGDLRGISFVTPSATSEIEGGDTSQRNATEREGGVLPQFSCLRPRPDGSKFRTEKNDDHHT